MTPDSVSSDRAQAEAVQRPVDWGSPVIRDVLDEVKRATRKFPTWPTDPLHALAVLGEEFGELTKAMLQLTYEPHKTSGIEVRAEAIQTAAMALRLAASLDHYVYAKAAQHEQERWDAARKAYYDGGGLHPCYD